MGVFKNDKLIIKLIAAFLFDMYRSTQKKVSVPPVTPSIVASGLSLILLQNFFNLVPFITYSLVGGLGTFMFIDEFKEFFDSRTETIELQPENKDPNNFPPITFFPEELPKKRVLALNLSSPFYIGQYVIFKQQNKKNVSSVHINKGDIGKIIKRLNIWDFALVDFSVTIPDNFKNWNTKLIADKASNEAIVIVEAIKTGN